MVLAIAVFGVVLLGVAVRRLRRPSPAKRWSVVTATVLAGLVVAVGVGGPLVALAVGRPTWNAWTAGTPHREDVTLSLLMGVPLLLALAVLFLVVGSFSDSRRRHLETRRPPRSR